MQDHFTSAGQTMVMAVTIPKLQEGFMNAFGVENTQATAAGPTAATYWSGPACGMQGFYNYEDKFGSAVQWYAGVYGVK